MTTSVTPRQMRDLVINQSKVILHLARSEECQSIMKRPPKIDLGNCDLDTWMRRAKSLRKMVGSLEALISGHGSAQRE